MSYGSILTNNHLGIDFVTTVKVIYKNTKKDDIDKYQNAVVDSILKNTDIVNTEKLLPDYFLKITVKRRDHYWIWNKNSEKSLQNVNE